MFSSQWDLRGDMSRLQNELNRVFGRLGDVRDAFGPTSYPALNVWQDDDHVYVEAELPGFELDDLVIYVTGANQLSLKGERKQPNLGTKAAWHRQERGYGSFSRVCDLPFDVDADKVAAELKQGVLLVKLPKHEEVKPRRIQVKCV